MTERQKTVRQETAEAFVKSDLDRLRHSASHIMAQAVKCLYPMAKLGIGPAIQNGFYYDFDVDTTFTENDLDTIEKKMKEIILEHYPFVREEMPKAEAYEFFKQRGEIYKCELIQGIVDSKVSIYRDGDFVDLCKGPHMSHTGEVKAVKLISVAGAYWRGDEQNKMLQRIYGTAFFSQQELDRYLKNLEEAKRRDHRKLGRELDLFSFQEASPGIPFFHPRGMVVYEELLRYWNEEHEKEGYRFIKTPMILQEALWRQSGHYEHYKEHMYFTKLENQEFAIKPMNCPGSLLIYKSTQRSYRELPLRLAELGLVHRHELSGVLHGLFRVKAFTIDDAHIYCLESQLEQEVSQCIRLILRIYETFGFGRVNVELSTKPEKAMGSVEIWEKATVALRGALEKNQLQYGVSEGAGAFYGPKIDFHVEDSLARTWQCGTVQIDFSMPERFDLEYVGQDGNRHRPVMVHRACFGSVERFFGILVEHYGGAFPVWLAPVQVRVATISERHESFAENVHHELVKAEVRSELDIRSEKINFKVREAETLKIPYLAVVGDEEMKTETVALRGRGRKDLGRIEVSAFVEKVKQEIQARR